MGGVFWINSDLYSENVQRHLLTSKRVPICGEKNHLESASNYKVYAAGFTKTQIKPPFKKKPGKTMTGIEHF